jgi:hypothetical protein
MPTTRPGRTWERDPAARRRLVASLAEDLRTARAAEGGASRLRAAVFRIRSAYSPDVAIEACLEVLGAGQDCSRTVIW